MNDPAFSQCGYAFFIEAKLARNPGSIGATSCCAFSRIIRYEVAPMELRRKPGVPCAIDRKLLRSYTTEVPLLITPESPR